MSTQGSGDGPDTSRSNHVNTRQSMGAKSADKQDGVRASGDMVGQQGKQAQFSQVVHSEGSHAYRAVFRNEMHRLHRELETFKEQIANEYQKNARRIGKKKKALEEELRNIEEQREYARIQMENVEPTVEEERAREGLMRRKHALLDEEMELLDREDQLAQRQCHMEEYEAEIENIERYLERRMQISKRRNIELVELDEDMRALEDDQRASGTLEDVKHPIVHERDLAYNLLEEQKGHLELALKRAKADTVKAENTIDILQSKISLLEKCQRNADKRVNELETQLALKVKHASNILVRCNSLQPTTSQGSRTSQKTLTTLAPNKTVKPVRLSVKLKSKRSPSVGAEPLQADSYKPRDNDRPTFLWQHLPGQQSRALTSGTGTGSEPLRSVGRMGSRQALDSSRSENAAIGLRNGSQETQGSQPLRRSSMCAIQ